jgi:hypothetical protein
VQYKHVNIQFMKLKQVLSICTSNSSVSLAMSNVNENDLKVRYGRKCSGLADKRDAINEITIKSRVFLYWKIAHFGYQQSTD